MEESDGLRNVPCIDFPCCIRIRVVHCNNRVVHSHTTTTARAKSLGTVSRWKREMDSETCHGEMQYAFRLLSIRIRVVHCNNRFVHNQLLPLQKQVLLELSAEGSERRTATCLEDMLRGSRRIRVEHCNNRFAVHNHPPTTASKLYWNCLQMEVSDGLRNVP
jgi:hypothetical protein